MDAQTLLGLASPLNISPVRVVQVVQVKKEIGIITGRECLSPAGGGIWAVYKRILSGGRPGHPGRLVGLIC